MKRFFIKHTGFSGELDTGVILNKDGTEYTDDMTEAQSQILTPTPIIVADGIEIQVKPVPNDVSSKDHAKVHLIFSQINTDDESVTVATLRITGAELSKLEKLVKKKNDELSRTPAPTQ